jgi:hypothetical protein
MRDTIVAFGLWMDGLSGVEPRGAAPFASFALFLGLGWSALCGGFIILSLGFWQLVSDPTLRWLKGVDKLLALPAVPVILLRRGSFKLRHWNPNGKGCYAWGGVLVFVGIFTLDLLYDDTETVTFRLRIFQTMALMSPPVVGFLANRLTALLVIVVGLARDGWVVVSGRAKSMGSTTRDRVDDAVYSAGPARWLEWCSDRWLDLRIKMGIPNRMPRHSARASAASLQGGSNGEPIELLISESDDWVLFDQAAHVIQVELGGAWVKQLDAVDQRHWVLRVGDALLTLTLEVYTGIALAPASETPDIKAAEALIRQLSDVLNPSKRRRPRRFSYADRWRGHRLLCACGWCGPLDQEGGESHRVGMQFRCPECGTALTIVLNPSAEERSADTDKPSESEHQEVLERTRGDILQRPEQLPELDDGAFELEWDFTSEGAEQYTVIRHRDVVVWREPAVYEGAQRFREIATVLQAKYEGRVRDLIPTEASEYYLYGDKVRTWNAVEEVRKTLSE